MPAARKPAASKAEPDTTEPGRPPGDDQSGVNDPPTVPAKVPPTTTYTILREFLLDDSFAAESSATDGWVPVAQITVAGRNVPSNRLAAIKIHIGGDGIDALVGRWRAVVETEWDTDVVEVEEPIEETRKVAVFRVVKG